MKDTDTRWATLSTALAEAGLWYHLPPAKRRAAAADVARGEYPFDSDLLDDEILFFADGEELAEGGVRQLLAQIAPALLRYGLTLDVEVVADPYEAGGGHVLAVNGTRCVIWSEDEEGDDDLWRKATARPIRLVNALLGASGAAVRAYLLYEGGNEGLLLLLNPVVPAAMRASGLFEEEEIPALPSQA